MENASKALIIAGAILLSILIISLGIVVVNNTRTTIDKANVNQQEVQTFNSQFESYVGEARTISDVRALFSTVISSNGAQTRNNTDHYIKNAKSNIATDIPAPSKDSDDVKNLTIPNNLVNGHSFKIQLGYDSQGYVSAFSVQDKTATPQAYK